MKSVQRFYNRNTRWRRLQRGGGQADGQRCAAVRAEAEGTGRAGASADFQLAIAEAWYGNGGWKSTDTQHKPR